MFCTPRAQFNLYHIIACSYRLKDALAAGEAIIPLQEFSSVRSEVRRYTLGRRNVKEKVLSPSDNSDNCCKRLVDMPIYCDIVPDPTMSGPRLPIIPTSRATLFLMPFFAQLNIGCKGLLRRASSD